MELNLKGREKLSLNVIVFDFDGVIINSGADLANAVQYTQRQLGRPVLPKEEIISYVGRGVENLIRRSFKGSSEEIIQKAIPIYKEYYYNNCVVDTVLYPNVKEILEYFKDKKIALVTNKPENMSRKILECLNVNQYFDMIIGPESVKNMKPDPEGLLKVLDTFGESPKKAIMVGDSHTDVEAGKKAGMYTCGVTYGLGSSEDLIKAEPDFLFDDIAYLKDAII